jgi:hypothetical protein
VGAAILGKRAPTEALKIAGRTIAPQTANAVVGGGAAVLAGKGALDLISPNQPGYSQWRGQQYA